MAGREDDEACSPSEHARRKARVLDARTASRAAAMLSAAGEAQRLRLLVILMEGPADVSSLAARAGARFAMVSQHLATLRNAKLVRGTRKGRRIEYALADAHAERLVVAALAFAARLSPARGLPK